MFDGTATDSSYLHDADLGSELDSNADDEEDENNRDNDNNGEDDEFDFENPGQLFRSAEKNIMSLSYDNNKTNNSSNKNLLSATKTPRKSKKNLEKHNERLASQIEIREAKLETARKKRLESKNEKRMELANSIAPEVSEACGEGAAGSGSVRKKRASCAISQDLVQNYVHDFDLNRLASKSSARTASLIAGAFEDVIGPRVIPNTLSLAADIHDAYQMMSPDEKMRLLDRNFKDGLMLYCQVELFKDVTFDRLLVNYCIAKREAAGIYLLPHTILL
jgi:hypothetical protein